jgi:hypothetical protein
MNLHSIIPTILIKQASEEYKLYYFEGRNTGIAARSEEEARAKKKRGGDKLVAVRTPSDSEKRLMESGKWVRTRYDGKPPGKSEVEGPGMGPPLKKFKKAASFFDKLVSLLPAGNKFVKNKNLYSNLIHKNLGAKEDLGNVSLFSNLKDKLTDAERAAQFDRSNYTNYQTGDPFRHYSPDNKVLREKDFKGGIYFADPTSSSRGIQLVTEGPTKQFAYMTNSANIGPLTKVEGSDIDLLSSYLKALNYGEIKADPDTMRGFRNNLLDREGNLRGVKSVIGSPQYRTELEQAVGALKEADKNRNLLAKRDIPLTSAGLGGLTYGGLELNAYLKEKNKPLISPEKPQSNSEEISFLDKIKNYLK